MRRHVEVNGVTSMVAQYYEDKQQAKAKCRHDQEINRHQLLDVVLKKCAPRFHCSGWLLTRRETLECVDTFEPESLAADWKDSSSSAGLFCANHDVARFNNH
jgi:hypothetical protein